MSLSIIWVSPFLTEISDSAKDLASRAKGSGSPLTQEENNGATFSVSNLGMFDIDEFVAIIVPPQSAILSVGKAREEAVVENGEIKTAQLMKMTLSVDVNQPEILEFNINYVDDVKFYENIKLKILNASHSAIAYIGHLLGYVYVHEAINDDICYNFISSFLDKEVIPTLPQKNGFDLEGYKNKVLNRFKNSNIENIDSRHEIFMESDSIRNQAWEKVDEFLANL